MTTISKFIEGNQNKIFITKMALFNSNNLKIDANEDTNKFTQIYMGDMYEYTELHP